MPVRGYLPAKRVNSVIHDVFRQLVINRGRKSGRVHFLPSLLLPRSAKDGRTAICEADSSGVARRQRPFALAGGRRTRADGHADGQPRRGSGFSSIVHLCLSRTICKDLSEPRFPAKKCITMLGPVQNMNRSRRVTTSVYRVGGKVDTRLH